MKKEAGQKKFIMWVSIIFIKVCKQKNIASKRERRTEKQGNLIDI